MVPQQCSLRWVDPNDAGSTASWVECPALRCLPCLVQGCVQPVTAVCSVALALSPLFNWLLIFKLGLGIDGAVAAMVANNATMLLLLVAYLVWHERRRIGTAEQTWHGW